MSTCRAEGGDDVIYVVLVLHRVHHRGTPKRVSDVCVVLDIEDAHVVASSLRRLAAAVSLGGAARSAAKEPA